MRKGTDDGTGERFCEVFLAISRLLQPFHVTLMRLIISAFKAVRSTSRFDAKKRLLIGCD